MVVTCPLGMRIPVGPVSEKNPVLSAKVMEREQVSLFQYSETAERCSAHPGSFNFAQQAPTWTRTKMNAETE